MKKIIIKKTLSLALAALMVLYLSVPAMAADGEGHWADPYVEDAIERGWITGAAADPEEPVTRAEFAEMLWLSLGSPEPKGNSPFKDITSDAVTALYELGIVEGYGGGLFGPGDALTREMAIVMLSRAFDLLPISDDEAGEFRKFDDYRQISVWASTSVSALMLKGYVEGDGKNFMPQKSLTLGELLKLLIVVSDGENPPPEVKPPVIYVPPVTYTLTYDANGGAGAPESVTASGSVTIAGDSGMTAPYGKTFYGWNTEMNGSGDFYWPEDNITLTADTTLYAYWTGVGIAGDPIEINGAAGLKAMARGLALHYVLMDDITLTGTWTPIGGDYSSGFTGTFDGSGHTISNMTITGDLQYAGLFGYIDAPGAVRNVALTGVNIDVTQTADGSANAGGIAGENRGTVENCSVQGSVKAETTGSGSNVNAGGIAGWNDGQVENCYAVGDVEASNADSNAYAGGIAGKNADTVENCYAIGAVAATTEGTGSHAFAGGIAGDNEGGSTVENCAALCDRVSANEGISGGANRVVGNNTGTLTKNYANSAMTVTGSGGGPGADGTDVTLADTADENWWSTSAGIDWSAVWGGDSDADESRPWKMGTVDGEALPVLYWQ